MCSLKLWKSAPIKSPRHGTFLTSTFSPTMFFVSSHPLLDSLDHLYFNHLGFQIYLQRDLWIILIILSISFFTLFFLIFDLVLLLFSPLVKTLNLLSITKMKILVDVFILYVFLIFSILLVLALICVNFLSFYRWILTFFLFSLNDEHI